MIVGLGRSAIFLLRWAHPNAVLTHEGLQLASERSELTAGGDGLRVENINEFLEHVDN